MIEFLNLKAVNQRFIEPVQESIERILNSGCYLSGRELEEFESNFATYCGCSHAVGVASGLDALILIIRGYKFGPGDEIIVPSNTYIASVLAITLCQAKPVFVEPDPVTHLLDPAEIEGKISKNTKAIMPVHLYGRVCDMDKILLLAQKYNLKIIDDAAQAHGTILKIDTADKNWEERAIAFSFYPSKNLGAMADAGAVVTNDSELANTIRALRNYGSHKRYYNKYTGLNSRMDEMQAAILNVKLQHLDNDNSLRRKTANLYLQKINNPNIVLPSVPENPKKHVWHLFVIRTRHRDELRDCLASNSIQSQIHYPVPPHQQECYKDCNKLSLPISERLANEVLSLPISPVMAEDDVLKVAEVVNAWK